MIMASPAPSSFGACVKRIYVRILLVLLPLLINITRHVSRKIQAEVDYLAVGYTFKLAVAGTNLSCVCQKTERGGFRGIPAARVARDVEEGSGLASADANAVTVDYVICFRSLDYAFRCFSGGQALAYALAERAFTTRGPNDTGVALTYMFTALLRLFFFWRAPYRRKAACA